MSRECLPNGRTSDSSLVKRSVENDGEFRIIGTHNLHLAFECS